MVSERRLAYLARFAAEPPAFVRKKRPRPAFDGATGKLIWVKPPRPARRAGNALLSRLL